MDGRQAATEGQSPDPESGGEAQRIRQGRRGSPARGKLGKMQTDRRVEEVEQNNRLLELCVFWP